MVDKNPCCQLESLGEGTKVFTDQISGKSRAKRAGLTALMDYIREGGTVRVVSIDRLGRSNRDLFDLVDENAAKGAAVELITERITVDQGGVLANGCPDAGSDGVLRRVRGESDPETSSQGDCPGQNQGKIPDDPQPHRP